MSLSVKMTKASPGNAIGKGGQMLFCVKNAVSNPQFIRKKKSDWSVDG